MSPTDERRVVNGKSCDAATPYLQSVAELEDPKDVIDWIDTLSLRVQHIFKEQQLELVHLEARRQAEVKQDELRMKSFDDDFTKLAELVQRDTNDNHVNTDGMSFKRDDINDYEDENSDLGLNCSHGDSESIKTADSYSDLSHSDREIELPLDADEYEEDDQGEEEYERGQAQYTPDGGGEEIMILSSEEEQGIPEEQDSSAEELEDEDQIMDNAQYNEVITPALEYREQFFQSDHSSAASDYDDESDNPQYEPADSGENELLSDHHQGGDSSHVEPRYRDNANLFAESHIDYELQSSTGGKLDSLISFAQQLLDQSSHSEEAPLPKLSREITEIELNSEHSLSSNHHAENGEELDIAGSINASNNASDAVGSDESEDTSVWSNAASLKSDDSKDSNTAFSMMPLQNNDAEQHSDSILIDDSPEVSDNDSRVIEDDEEAISGSLPDPDLVDELEIGGDPKSVFQSDRSLDEADDFVEDDVNFSGDSSQKDMEPEPSHEEHQKPAEGAKALVHNDLQQSKSRRDSYNKEMQDILSDSQSNSSNGGFQSGSFQVSPASNAEHPTSSNSQLSSELARFMSDEPFLNPPPVFKTLVEQSPEQVLNELKHLEERFGVALDVTKELEMQLLSEREKSSSPEDSSVGRCSETGVQGNLTDLIKARAMKILSSIRKAVSSEADRSGFDSNQFSPIIIPIIDAINSSDFLESSLSESSEIDSDASVHGPSIRTFQHAEGSSSDSTDLSDSNTSQEENEMNLGVLLRGASGAGLVMDGNVPMQELLAAPDTTNMSPDADVSRTNEEYTSKSFNGSFEIEPPVAADEANSAGDGLVSLNKGDVKLAAPGQLENCGENDANAFGNSEVSSELCDVVSDSVGEATVTAHIQASQELLSKSDLSSASEIELDFRDTQSDAVIESEIADLGESVLDIDMTEVFEEAVGANEKVMEIAETVFVNSEAGQESESQSEFRESEVDNQLVENTLRSILGTQAIANLAFPHSIPSEGIDESCLGDLLCASDGGKEEVEEAERTATTTGTGDDTAHENVDSLLTESAHCAAIGDFLDSTPISEQALSDETAVEINERLETPELETMNAEVHEDYNMDVMRNDEEELPERSDQLPDHGIVDKDDLGIYPRDGPAHDAASEEGLTVLQGLFDADNTSSIVIELLSEEEIPSQLAAVITPTFIFEPDLESDPEPTPSAIESQIVETTVIVEALESDESEAEQIRSENSVLIGQVMESSDHHLLLAVPTSLGLDFDTIETVIAENADGSGESGSDSHINENKRSREEDTLDVAEHPFKRLRQTLSRFIPKKYVGYNAVTCIPKPELSPIEANMTDSSETSSCGSDNEVNDDEGIADVEGCNGSKNDTTVIGPDLNSSLIDDQVLSKENGGFPLRDGHEGCAESELVHSESVEKICLTEEITVEGFPALPLNLEISKLGAEEEEQEDSTYDEAESDEASLSETSMFKNATSADENFERSTVISERVPQTIEASEEVEGETSAVLEPSSDKITSSAEEEEEEDEEEDEAESNEEAQDGRDSPEGAHEGDDLHEEADPNEATSRDTPPDLGTTSSVAEDIEIPKHISEPSKSCEDADTTSDQSAKDASKSDAGSKDDISAEIVPTPTPSDEKLNARASDGVADDSSPPVSMPLSTTDFETSDAAPQTLPTHADSSDVHKFELLPPGADTGSGSDAFQRSSPIPKTVRVLGLDVPEKVLLAPRSLRNGHVFGTLDPHPDPPLIMRKVRNKRGDQGLALPETRGHPASRTRSKSPMKRSLRQLSSELEDELAIKKNRRVQSSEQPSSDAESDDEKRSSRTNVESTRGRRRH